MFVLTEAGEKHRDHYTPAALKRYKSQIRQIQSSLILQQFRVCASLMHSETRFFSVNSFSPLSLHSQTTVLLRHVLNVSISSLETLSFFLTLLAPAVTPLFVLSERWIHMPCGCFINCKQASRRGPSGKQFTCKAEGDKSTPRVTN